MYPAKTDVIRRVQNNDGEKLDICPWHDDRSLVVLKNSDPESAKYLGNIELFMFPAFAREIGKALIACADEIEAQGE